MNDLFTKRSRRVMQLANQESQHFNQKYISTEHILLALIEEGSGVAAHVLKHLDVDPGKVRYEVEKLAQMGPHLVATGERSHSPEAEKFIDHSIEEARNLNHNYVGTEHLLLALMRDQDLTGAQVLMNQGLKLEEVRQEVLNLLGHGIEAAGQGESDDSSSKPS